MTEEKTITKVFNNMLAEMKGELTYTEFSAELKKERDNKCKPQKLLNLNDCAKDPTLFAYHILGISPYLYQFQMFEYIRKGKKRIVMITSRQIGKTEGLAIIAVWAAFNNAFPSGLHRNTKVLIVSKSEEQAKMIVTEIKKLIDLGDRIVEQRTKGNVTNYISRELDEGKTQTAFQSTFKNGCYIKCIAPTGSGKGYTVDVLILDEFAYIPEELFNETLEPTTSAVDGIILMASTPNGMQGLGYKIFDPENIRQNNRYERIWVPWWKCENPRQLEWIKNQKEEMIAKGDIKSFQQEYEAKFTTSESSFFDADKVDKSIDSSLAHVMDWHTEPCSIGIDYGFKSSRTVLTIVSKGKDGVIRERFQHTYIEEGSDLNVDVDVENLMKRFNIIHVVPDDCPSGFNPNQKMIQKGFPVKLFNFRTDQNAGERNRGYYMLRAGLYQNKVKITKNVELIREMKSLLEIHKEINITIKGECCDRCFVAGTKIITNKGNIKIENIDVGDMVLTSKGFKRVLQTHINFTDKDNILNLLGLKGTKNHPFITKGGITNFINLNVSDTIYTWNEKQLSITEQSIIDTLIQNYANGEYIIGAIQKERIVPRHYTGKYGKILMEKYLKGILFTIKTKIQKIIPLKILNVLLQKNIAKGTEARNLYKNGEIILLPMQFLKQLSGINRKKGRNGIRNIMKLLLKKHYTSLMSIPVSGAEEVTKITERLKQNIVLIDADGNIGLKLEKVQKPVKGIQKENVIVFNLTVEGCNEYFANNILVHNCDSLCMGCYPFLAEGNDTGFGVINDIDMPKEVIKADNGRHDIFAAAMAETQKYEMEQHKKGVL